MDGWSKNKNDSAYSSIKGPLKRLAFPGMGNLDPKYNPNEKNDSTKMPK